MQVESDAASSSALISAQSSHHSHSFLLVADLVHVQNIRLESHRCVSESQSAVAELHTFLPELQAASNFDVSWKCAEMQQKCKNVAGQIQAKMETLKQSIEAKATSILHQLHSNILIDEHAVDMQRFFKDIPLVRK